METTKTDATREELDALIASITTELDTAQATAATRVAEIMGTTPIDYTALALASAPVVSVQTRLDNARERLAAFIKNDAWENNPSLRKPVHDAIKALNASIPVTRLFGKILIERVPVVNEDGTVDETKPPVNIARAELDYEAAKLDLDAIADKLTAGLNVDELFAHGITSLTLNVSKLDSSKDITFGPTLTTKEAAAKLPKATGSSANGSARAGALEYEYKGEWLGSRELLNRLEAEKGDSWTRHSGSSAWPSIGGEGMSNLAKTIARNELKLPERTRPAA